MTGEKPLILSDSFSGKKGKTNIIEQAVQLAGGDTQDIIRGVLSHTPEFDFSISNKSNPSIRGLGIDFFDHYSDNKYLTSLLLKRNNINTPKQILIKSSLFYSLLKTNNPKERYIKICNEIKQIIEKEFPNNHLPNSLVKKPISGCQGSGISFFNIDQVSELVDSMQLDSTMVVEERIESYPISINKKSKDWNLRTFVTYNFEKEEYTCFAMVGRIDNDGGPVNLSITAGAISIDEILSHIDISDEKKEELIKNILTISEQASKSVIDIAEKANQRTGKDKYQGKQLLAGIDIIIDNKLVPWVIEVNGANSGGLEALNEISGINPIIPFGKSIVNQAINNFNDGDIPKLEVPQINPLLESFINKVIRKSDNDDRKEKEEKKQKIKKILKDIRKNQTGTKFQDMISIFQEI